MVNLSASLLFPVCLESNNWVSEAADGCKLSPFVQPEVLPEDVWFPI